MKRMLAINPNIWGDNMMTYAYPLSILSAYPSMTPWLMENYIIPFTFTPYQKVSELHIRMLYLDACCFAEDISLQQPVMHQDNYAQDSLSHKSIVDIIKRLIDKGKYAIVFSDDYYLPSSIFSGAKMHFLHETLFYGYDEKLQVFYAMGMNTRKKYGRIIHRFSEVETAFRKGDVCDHHGDIEWAREHRIIALSLDDYHGTYPFDPQRLAAGLEAFATGRISPRQRFLLNLDYRGDLCFGIDYYSFVADTVEQAEPQSFRYIHHLYEHANLLHERLNYTVNHENVHGSLIADFQRQLNRISIARAKTLKYTVVNPQKEKAQLIFKSESLELAASIREHADDMRRFAMKWIDSLCK